MQLCIHSTNQPTDGMNQANQANLLY